MPDVTVVGGGPAGSLTARLLAASGRDVVLLEEHNEAGVPTHCAGFVSDDVIQKMGVRPNIYSTICRADVKLPDGRVLEIGRKSPIGFIVDRADLDAKMVDLAAKHGVDVHMGERCTEVTATDAYVTAKTNDGEIKSDLLVGADGQNSTIAASWGNNMAREYLRGFQMDVRHTMDEQDRMILRVGNDIAPGLFAWQLPMGDLTRVGVCVSPNAGTPAEYVKRLLKNIGLADCKVEQSFGGKVPIGGRRTSVNNRVMLIGDAAGQVKPVSAGGLYPIAVAAPILADTVSKAYEMNVFSTAVLALYERGWKRELGKSLDGGMRLRKMYCRMSDRNLCAIAKIFDTPEILGILSNIDIDDPTTVVKPILKQRGVKSRLLGIYLRSLF